MNTGRFLRISNGDYFRPESVIAVTVRDRSDTWMDAQVTVVFEYDQRLWIECKTFDEAKKLRGEIMDAINNRFGDPAPPPDR